MKYKTLREFQKDVHGKLDDDCFCPEYLVPYVIKEVGNVAGILEKAMTGKEDHTPDPELLAKALGNVARGLAELAAIEEIIADNTLSSLSLSTDYITSGDAYAASGDIPDDSLLARLSWSCSAIVMRDEPDPGTQRIWYFTVFAILFRFAERYCSQADILAISDIGL